MALTRYLSFEEAPPDWSSDGEQSDEDAPRPSFVDSPESNSRPRASSLAGSSVLRDQQFLRAQHAAYFNPVKIVLERVCAFSHAAFTDHSHWLVPLLTRMIVCENAAVRILVRQIFQQFIDPMFVHQR